MQIPPKKPKPTVGKASGPVAPTPSKPSSSDGVSSAVEAVSDGLLTKAEVGDLKAKKNVETDAATRAFLETVAGKAESQLTQSQTSATGWHRTSVLVQARMALGLDPKDPVVGSVEASRFLLGDGVVKAWVKTSPAKDQDSARAEFKQLLAEGAFFDAAVSAAYLEPKARLDALTALAKSARDLTEVTAVDHLIRAGETLTQAERSNILQVFITNPQLSGDQAILLIDKALSIDGTQQTLRHRGEVLRPMLDTWPANQHVREAAVNHLASSSFKLNEPEWGVQALATKLLLTGAPLIDVLAGLFAWKRDRDSPELATGIDRLMASLLTDVLPQVPGGLEAAKVHRQHNGYWSWGRLTEAAAVKMGVAPPEEKPAKTS